MFLTIIGKATRRHGRMSPKVSSGDKLKYRKVECACKQDMLELKTLWYMVGLICLPDNVYTYVVCVCLASFKIIVGAFIKKQHKNATSKRT